METVVIILQQVFIAPETRVNMFTWTVVEARGGFKLFKSVDVYPEILLAMKYIGNGLFVTHANAGDDVNVRRHGSWHKHYI